MIHPSLPQTYTPENLAIWIKQNSIESRNHVEDIDFTEDEIKDLEHRSSAASRAIDKLESQLKSIQEVFKKGTQEAFEFTIYPTKGLEVLKANRKFADDQVEKGSHEETTLLYGIPVPETKVVFFVDIEGTEFPQYGRGMSKDEMIAYNTLFSKDEQEATSKSVKFGSVKIEPVDPDDLFN